MGAFTNVRIVELAGGRSAALAAMLLAEIGADVVRIEPPEGDPERRIAPAAYAVHNRSKRSLVLDLDRTEGVAELERLLGAADVLIHDRQAGALGGLLDSKMLAARFPHLIISHIGSWPVGHPRAATPVDDGLVLAEAGVFDEQPPIGRKGPGFVRFPLGEGGAAYLSTMGIAARLFRRLSDGGGCPVETSLIQGAMTSLLMLWSRAERPTEMLSSVYIPEVIATQFECGDGGWIHVMANPDRAPLMAAGLAALDPQVREAAIRNGRQNPGYPSWGANILVFKTKSRDEWLDNLWAHDVAAQPAQAVGEIYRDQQALINGYVIEVDDPVLGLTMQPGSPVQIDPPAGLRHPAPVLDDGRNLVAAWDARPVPAGDISNKLPLAGVKILDLGNFLAGPMAPMIMADMGAEVIKLESTTGDQMRYVDWAFAGCQRNKRAIALDLKSPQARPVLERLVKWADVVHHNLRMPAAIKLGLDYETLKAINPSLIYCHVSSYGPVGPRKDWPGYDQMMQASCGWEYEGAGAGTPPTWYRFGMMDHQCAMASGLATLVALRQRAQDGRGRAVAASLLGAGLVSQRETVLLADGTLAPFPRLDGRQMGTSSRRRLFACADGWVMTVTEAEGSHEAMLAALDAKDVLALEATCAALPVAKVIAVVAEAGGNAVRARESQREAFLSDPANIAARLVSVNEHPTYGRFEQMGSLVDFGLAVSRLDMPPPVLGEHTRAILKEAGFALEEVDGLIESGAVVAWENASTAKASLVA